MTESYDPYANAVAERVNGILKNEFMIESYKLNNEKLNLLIGNSVEKYNKIRPHYSCHMLTPEQMHLQNKIKIRTYKKQISCKASLATD
jgi:transposase InsO family protein